MPATDGVGVDVRANKKERHRPKKVNDGIYLTITGWCGCGLRLVLSQIRCIQGMVLFLFLFSLPLSLSRFSNKNSFKKKTRKQNDTKICYLPKWFKCSLGVRRDSNIKCRIFRLSNWMSSETNRIFVAGWLMNNDQEKWVEYEILFGTSNRSMQIPNCRLNYRIACHWDVSRCCFFFPKDEAAFHQHPNKTP